jgi:hypothetical protein
MGILLEIGLVVVLIAIFASYAMRGRLANDKQAMVDRRVEAYMETIRRERSNPDLSAMSDNELRDLLLSSAHNLKVQRERRLYLLLGGVIAAVIGAILVATDEGARGFGIALLVGALVLYGVNEFLGRQMIAPLEAKGIDVERLRVE